MTRGQRKISMRRAFIKAHVRNQVICSVEQLQQALEAIDVFVANDTIRRDLAALGFAKQNGSYKFIAGNPPAAKPSMT